MIGNTASPANAGEGTFSSLPARRRAASLFALFGLGLLGSWIASCNEDSPRACVPGAARLCAGPGRCRGDQECLPDGSGYGECDCSGPLRETMDPEPPPVLTSLVGRRCVQDPDCGDGLRCYASSSNELFGGGASGGYCSMPCTGDAACRAVDPDSQCVGLQGSQSVCLRTCFSSPGTFTGGPAAPGSLIENKCLQRSDVVCLSEAAQGIAMFSGSRQPGLCYPQCGSDEDCAGRLCDLSRGLCVDSPASGAPVGAACRSGMECAGRICVAANAAGTEAFCSAPCVLGQPIGCGYGPSAVVREAGCLGPRVSGFLSNEGVGDSGFCAELCDVDADCSQAANNSAWTCVVSDGARERFGRAGVCGLRDVTDAGTDAGDAAAAPDDASVGG